MRRATESEYASWRKRSTGSFESSIPSTIAGRVEHEHVAAGLALGLERRDLERAGVDTLAALRPHRSRVVDVVAGSRDLQLEREADRPVGHAPANLLLEVVASERLRRARAESAGRRPRVRACSGRNASRRRHRGTGRRGSRSSCRSRSSPAGAAPRGWPAGPGSRPGGARGTAGTSTPSPDPASAPAAARRTPPACAPGTAARSARRCRSATRPAGTASPRARGRPGT